MFMMMFMVVFCVGGKVGVMMAMTIVNTAAMRLFNIATLRF
jgi:hypothetical protein